MSNELKQNFEIDFSQMDSHVDLAVSGLRVIQSAGKYPKKVCSSSMLGANMLEAQRTAISKMRSKIECQSTELEQLRKDLEEQKAQNLVQAWDIEKLLVVMQASYIEMAKGDQKNANAWIVNTLFGPGLIPENTDISAQEHFDNALKDRVETIEQALAKLNQ